MVKRKDETLAIHYFNSNANSDSYQYCYHTRLTNTYSNTMIQECNLIWRYLDTDTGLIMPWYSLPCLEWLKKQDISDWRIFEYGSGYSTCWWRANAEGWYSVDNDAKWAKAMGATFSDNQGVYINSIKNWMYDCIIIDGAWRKECLEYCLPFIKIGGYIIIDNYGQEDFPDTEFAEKLLEGWEKKIYKQPNHTTWASAVFKKP